MSKKISIKLILLALVFSGAQGTHSVNAASHAGLSHLHDVIAFGKEILLATHEGLYKYIDKNTSKFIGKDKSDLMGLSVDGKNIYASGHPATGSKAINPVGLVVSQDKGLSWKNISLEGQVDFHYLEVSNGQIYGINASDGNLMYSSDLGKKWINRGSTTFSDIAIDPTKKSYALALQGGKLYTSSNALKSVTILKQTQALTVLDWKANSLLAASGNTLLRSTDSGVSWKLVKTFSSPIESVTQSESLIAVVSGGRLEKSLDKGKTFLNK